MENAHIMLEMAEKCSNYAKNWGLRFSFWIMLCEADYAKNYAGILYQCLPGTACCATLNTDEYRRSIPSITMHVDRRNLVPCADKVGALYMSIGLGGGGGGGREGVITEVFLTLKGA